MCLLKCEADERGKKREMHEKWNYYVRRGFFHARAAFLWEAWKDCTEGAEVREKGSREPCISRRKSDVGLWTEMSSSSQNWKERLEVSRNRAAF